MRKIEIPIKPVSKPRMTKRDVWRTDPDHPNPDRRKRPAVQKYHDFVNELNLLVKGSLDARFIVVFNVEMPRSWSEKKKAEFDGKPHQVKPDIDNFLKAFMDALCEDDSYIYDVHPKKFWARKGNIILEEYDE